MCANSSCSFAPCCAAISTPAGICCSSALCCWSPPCYAESSLYHSSKVGTSQICFLSVTCELCASLVTWLITDVSTAASWEENTVMDTWLPQRDGEPVLPASLPDLLCRFGFKCAPPVFGGYPWKNPPGEMPSNCLL